MAFIRIQKAIKDEKGNYIGGNASIVQSVYVPSGDKNHCKQEVIEALGTVLFLNKEKTYGKFYSLTRGYVAYDSVTNAFTKLDRDDGAVIGHSKKELSVHTVFGDTWFIYEFLKKTPYFKALKDVFPADKVFERVFAHLTHGIARAGQDIDCGDFAVKDFLSYIIPGIGLTSLDSDTEYFRMLSDPNLKLKFFKDLTKMMKAEFPAFGKCCFIDSTPLPNEIERMVQNYYCNHGTNASALQVRLVLVLDKATDIPVWYDVIPGNITDLKTVDSIYSFITDELLLEVDEMVLDAGYCSRDLIESYGSGHLSELLVRMPAKRGYGHRALYDRCFPQFGQAKYSFIREGHMYYGKCIRKELWGVEMNAYVYVDKQNALNAYYQYLDRNEEEFMEMKDKDKNWKEFCGGFFVLLKSLPPEGAEAPTPKQVLDEYFRRTRIETVFKAAKNYIKLLPLAKEDPDAVAGKIFNDVIATGIILTMLEKANEKMKKLGLPKIFARLQSLMCTLTTQGVVLVDAPNRQTKEVMDSFGIMIPGHLLETEYSNLLK